MVGSAAVWFVVSNLAGPGGGHMGGHERGTPGTYDCCCLLGYGLLPMLLHALISLLVPKCVGLPETHAPQCLVPYCFHRAGE